MSRDREFVVRDEVLFDNHNVQDTAHYCWTHNRYLQGIATLETAADKLIVEVLKRIQQGSVTSAELFPIFDAWCVVDAVPPGTDGIVADVSYADIRWQTNFFVRLGRSPALQDTSTSD